MVKVLYLTNLPAPYKVDFFNRLGKFCELTVLFERNTASNRDGKWKSDERRSFDAVFLKGIKTGKEDALCFSVVRYLEKSDYDFIVICGYTTPTSILAITYCKIKRIPYVLSIDGAKDTTENGAKRWLKSLLIRGAQLYLCPGRESFNYLLHHGANEKKIRIYPFTSLQEKQIDSQILSLEEKNKIKHELDIQEEIMILAVGQYINRKGFDILLNAVDFNDPRIGVYIIGGEKPLDEYIRIIGEKSLINIHFLDFQKSDMLKKYYHAADVFVLPTRCDIWGLVINEAMANGLPVITTTECVAGIELVQDDENGYLIPANNSEILKIKLIEVLFDESKRRMMGKNSLKKIQRYSIENMAFEHFVFFSEHIKPL